MSEALLGPSFDVCVKLKEPNEKKKLSELLSHKQTVAQELKESVWKRFTEIVKEVVSGVEYEHDGFSFDWEGAYVFDDDEFSKEEISISFGINVLVKEDDFDFFDSLLNRDDVLDVISEQIKEKTKDYISKNGMQSLVDSIVVKCDEFGYG